MAKPITYNILNSLCKAVKTTGIKYLYIINRPDVSHEQTEFVVIDLPSEIKRKTKGEDDFLLETEGIFYLGVKSKVNNTPNIEKQTELAQKLMNLFPIQDDYIVATRPSLLFEGSDKSNFQITTIAFNIRTKINSFNH